MITREIFGDEVNFNDLSKDDIQLILGEEIATIMADTSEMCKTMIENKIPGYEKFVKMDKGLNELYAYIKWQASQPDIGEEQATEESVKKSFNSLDSDSSIMNTKNDASAGLFVMDKQAKLNEPCPKCSAQATIKQVMKCKDSQCPYNHLDVEEGWLKQIEGKD